MAETMQQQLFDSMVSIRQDNNEQPHLGLGLYIVILIIESHNGPINAHSLLNNDGMECVIRIPEKTLANKSLKYFVGFCWALSKPNPRDFLINLAVRIRCKTISKHFKMVRKKLPILPDLAINT